MWNPPPTAEHSGTPEWPRQMEPHGPTEIEYSYTTTLSHLGFSESGDFTIQYSRRAPTGGILISRADNEFENAATLFHAGVPAIAPLLVAEYKSLRFEGEPLGVVVSLSHEPAPWRLHPLLLGEDGLSLEAKQFYQRLRDSLGFPGADKNQDTRLAVIGEISEKIGSALSKFDAAGLFQHSSGWDNYQYEIDGRGVLLTDLDSSAELAKIPAIARPLEMLRDLASALYNLVNKLYHPLCIGDYSLN